MRWIEFCGAFFVVWMTAMPSFADDMRQDNTPSIAPLADAVRVAPVPELSLMVPHGWVACDQATNEQLGGGTLPAQLQAKMCEPGQPPHAVFKLVNPNLTEFVVVIFMEFPEAGKPMLDRVISEAGDAQQRDIVPLCNAIVSGSPDSTCAANVGTVGGHQVVIGNLERTGQSANAQMDGKFIVLATSKHCYVLMFASVATAKPKASAVVDAIIDSIEVE